MDRWLVALVVGLLGGTGGALAVRALLPAPEASAGSGGGEPGLTARLERIEKVLVALEARGPSLTGRSEGPAGPGLGGAAQVLASSDGQALRQALREEVIAALDTRMEALEKAAKGPAAPAAPPEPKKRRVALSEAAHELALSSSEEAALRKVYADAEEKMLKVVAGPDGDVEAVRRDVEEAKRDPKKRNVVMMKYMPKLLPRIGDFMTLEMEKQMAIQEAVGPEKAARLESEFNVIEADPLGGDNEFRVEARSSNR